MYNSYNAVLMATEVNALKKKKDNILDYVNNIRCMLNK